MNLLKRSTKVFIDKISNCIFATHGKLNFRNMSRYIDIDEKTISRNYKKLDLDIVELVIKKHLPDFQELVSVALRLI